MLSMLTTLLRPSHRDKRTQLESFEVGEVVDDELYVCEAVVGQLHILDQFHARLRPLHDAYFIVFEILFDQRHNFLFFFVDLLDLLRDHKLLFGPINRDRYEMLSFFWRNFKYNILLQEMPL